MKAEKKGAEMKTEKKAEKKAKVKTAGRGTSKAEKKRVAVDFTPYKAVYTGNRFDWNGKTVSVIGPDSHGTSGAAANYRRVKLGAEEHNISLGHLKKVGGAPAAAPASKKKAKATEKSGAPVPAEAGAM